MHINLDIISWQYAILILVIILFLIWAMWGGGEYEYIGLAPLQIGYDAAKCVQHSKSDRRAKRVQSEPIDNTPKIPDLENFKSKKRKNRFSETFTNSISHDLPSVSDLVKPYNRFSDSLSTSFSDSYESGEMTPRTAALGPHKCRSNKRISNGERLCKQAIEEIYGVPFYCVRPDFLKNPETGRNLELDIYNDSLKIGVELNGAQHYQFPNTFHKTYEDFLSQVRRDQFKIDACDANGVYLITVPYNVKKDLESIKKYIEYYLPENYAKRLEMGTN